jgi:hypothetical protein
MFHGVVTRDWWLPILSCYQRLLRASNGRVLFSGWNRTILDANGSRAVPIVIHAELLGSNSQGGGQFSLGYMCVHLVGRTISRGPSWPRWGRLFGVSAKRNLHHPSLRARFRFLPRADSPLNSGDIANYHRWGIHVSDGQVPFEPSVMDTDCI